ncbi:MAG: SGNH/GDSL hydrolase family protein, partial [Bacteroidota bacterium]
AAVFYHTQFHPRIRLHINTDPWKPLQGKIDYLLLGKLSPLIRYDHWAFVPKLLFGRGDLLVNDPRLDSVSKNGYFHFKYKAITDSLRLRQLSEKNIEAHKRLINNNENLKLFWKELESIIVKTKEKNIQLILFTPPYYQFYNEISKELNLPSIQEQVQQFAKKYEVFYADYSNYYPISANWQYFDDGSHLNETGRQLFSALLLKEMSFKAVLKESN